MRKDLKISSINKNGTKQGLIIADDLELKRDKSSHLISMLLPSKHLSQERALLTVGGQVLSSLTHPKTVSALWEKVNRQDKSLTTARRPQITYDWFLLALDLLYILGAIELKSGLVTRRIS